MNTPFLPKRIVLMKPEEEGVLLKFPKSPFQRTKGLVLDLREKLIHLSKRTPDAGIADEYQALLGQMVRVLGSRLEDVNDRIKSFDNEGRELLEVLKKKKAKLREITTDEEAVRVSKIGLIAEDPDGFSSSEETDRVRQDEKNELEKDVYHCTRRLLRFLVHPKFRTRDKIVITPEIIGQADQNLVEQWSREAREDLASFRNQLHEELERKTALQASFATKKIVDTSLQEAIHQMLLQLSEITAFFDTDELSLVNAETQRSLSAALEQQRGQVEHLIHRVEASEKTSQSARSAQEQLMEHTRRLTSDLEQSKVEKGALEQQLDHLTQSLETQKSRSEQIQRQALEQKTGDREHIDELQRLLGQVGSEIETLEQNLLHERSKSGQIEEQLAQERARAQVALEDQNELTNNVTRLTAELESRTLDVNSLRRELQNITRTYGDQQSVTEQVRQQAADQHSADREQIEALHRMLEEQISASRQYRVQIEATMSQFQQEATEEADMKIEKLSALLNEERRRAEKLQEQLSIAAMKVSVLEAQKVAQAASAVDIRVIDEQLRGEQFRAAQAEQKLERARSRAKALQASLEKQQGLYLQAHDEVQKASLEVKNHQELLNEIHEFLKLFQQLNAHQQQFILSEHKIFDHLFKALEDLPRTRDLLRGTRLKLQEQFRRGDQAETRVRALENIIAEQRLHFDASLEEARVKAGEEKFAEHQATVGKVQGALSEVQSALEQERKSAEALLGEASMKDVELAALRAQVLELQGKRDEADQQRQAAEQLSQEQQLAKANMVSDFAAERARTKELFGIQLDRAEDHISRLNEAMTQKNKELSALQNRLRDTVGNFDSHRNTVEKKYLERDKEREALKGQIDTIRAAFESSKAEHSQMQATIIGEKKERSLAEQRALSLAHRLEQAELDLETHFTGTVRSKLLSLTELGRDLKLSLEDFEKLLSATLPVHILKDISDHILSQRLVVGFVRDPYDILEEVINDPSLSQRFRQTILTFREGLDVQRQLEVALKAFSRIRKPVGGAHNLQKYDINDPALEYLQDRLSEKDFQTVLEKAYKSGHFNNRDYMHRVLKKMEDFPSFLPQVILSEVENHMSSLLNESGSKVR